MRFLFLFIGFTLQMFSVVRVINCHANYPDFIELQLLTLNRFCIDDFELIVFNDGRTDEEAQAISEKCASLGVQCVRFEPEWHENHPLSLRIHEYLQSDRYAPNLFDWYPDTSLSIITACGSIRHSHVLQYAFENYVQNYDDVVVVLDADAFLIKPLSFRVCLEKYDLVISSRWIDHELAQRTKNIYSVSKQHSCPSPIVVFLDPTRLPDLDTFSLSVGLIGSTKLLDTGIEAYNYLLQHPEVRVKELYQLDTGMFYGVYANENLQEFGFSHRGAHFLEWLYPNNVQYFMGETFLHFGAISFGIPGFIEKASVVSSFLKELCLDSGPDSEKVY